MLRIGNKEVVDLKVGARQAVAAYLGTELVWQKSTPPSNWGQADDCKQQRNVWTGPVGV